MGDSKLTYAAPECWGVQLPLWASELADRGYESVSAVDFYDDIFGEDLEEGKR